ncbi:MAG TPA: rhomboid family intramembrane serine protease [Thermoanaerobaculia bacterium]|jgi:membrane associated rhomboid family serine protease
MFRSRGENLRFVFVLLFLNVAFFLLEHQDKEKYARMFAFDWSAVLGGEVWRLFTYQFTQAGSGFMEALSLFITLLLLYMMGSALEEEWGSAHFMTLFAVSTLGSAGMAAWLGIPLLGTYFVFFTLLFVYAAAFPQQTFYLFGAVPVRVRVLAFFSLAVLVYGVLSGGAANLAALSGAVFAYIYYLSQRVRVRFVVAEVPAAEEAPRVKIDTTAITNAARYAALRQVLASGAADEIERLQLQYERDTVANVNICPPADYKPENVDGYCIRCEGFAECSARYLRLNRPARVTAAPQVIAAPDVP